MGKLILSAIIAIAGTIILYFSLTKDYFIESAGFYLTPIFLLLFYYIYRKLKEEFERNNYSRFKKGVYITGAVILICSLLALLMVIPELIYAAGILACFVVQFAIAFVFLKSVSNDRRSQNQ